MVFGALGAREVRCWLGRILGDLVGGLDLELLLLDIVDIPEFLFGL